MVNKRVLLFILCVFFSMTGVASVTPLIPGSNGSLYYEIGGGDVTPLPYTGEGTDIHIDFGGNASLGFNCGAFDPAISIVNSLNSVEESFGNITQYIYDNMTSLIIGEAGYLMAKAMPNVYKFMRDGIDFGQQDFSLTTKSCETMLDDVDEGKNPGDDWMQVAMGDDWKYHMSLAGTQAAKQGMLGSSNDSDIVAAKADVDEDGGENGVQWVQGNSSDGQLYAGGKGQPKIYLTYDTVMAGYNVLVDPSRSYNDNSAPPDTDEYKRLRDDFSTPQDAANWMVKVVGEQEVTTYSGGDKKSTPGIGLLNDVQDQTTLIKDDLTDLIDGSKELNVDNLTAVSPPKIMLNDSVIEMLRKQTDPLMQAIYVNKLAAEVAVAQVIDKAKLGLQMLEVGKQVPEIYVNSAAQKGIEEDIKRMQQWISDLRANPRDNEEFVGKTVTTMMGATSAQERSSATIRPSGDQISAMEGGAIQKEQ
ncbi:MAG: integrating conjugative element protein [Gammaproteobacteria bacterium]|nr:integrating conjugative element protein [Gammaproteobacteria bacterium]